MSAPIAFRYRCADERCRAEFTLDSHERYSKSRAHCPACGSLYFGKLHNQKPIVALAGAHKSVLTPSSDKHLGIPGRRSAATTRKHARMVEAMSSPTKYRQVALTNNHARFKAKREIQAKKADRLRREKDWTPLK